MRMDSLREEIKDALYAVDFEKIARCALENKKVFSILISLTYDKEDLLCWRAIEAVGRAAGVVAKRDLPVVRNIVQRLLWSVREESGGIGWSAPEMLGEIVRNSPEAFSDIPPLIFSFHEEEMFLKGVLWAMGRLADAGINPVAGTAELAAQYLDHEDPLVRSLALLTISRMNVPKVQDKIKALTGDKARLRMYEDSELRENTVGNIATRTLQELREVV
ncbi:MAG: DVU0298 family protein [Thermodesulfovibrionales bacterium]|jgi:HEAT repeat protein